MPYAIAGQTYRTKSEVTRRCREILADTPVGGVVGIDDAVFLLDLFSHHTEWPKKCGPGVSAITVHMTAHGTRCFWLYRLDGQLIDISFPHAVKHLPTARKNGTLMPQPLIDFKNGARQAIKGQIDAFRQAHTTPASESRLDVDHVYPRTFDALLFGFCLEHGINPLLVEVIEREGCLHHIVDDAIREQWADYHRHYARLALVPTRVNLSAKKARIDWSQAWAKVDGEPSGQCCDVYTRTCPICGSVFQSDDHDDPDGSPVWMQWEGPCCIAATTEPFA